MNGNIFLERKFLISVLVMFIMLWAGGFVVHGMLLHGDYARLPNLMRPMPEFQSKWPLMALAHLCTAVAFSWIYIKGKENRPWLGQGARYGIAVAVLMTVPTYLIYHAVMPIPFELAVKQIICDTILVVLMGIVLAWINR